MRRYDTNQARLDALPAFIAYYNERAPAAELSRAAEPTAVRSGPSTIRTG